MNKSYTRTLPTRGVALLLLVVFSMMASLLLALGMSRTIYGDVVRAQTLLQSKQAFFAAESGVEDVVYRLRSNDTSLTLSPGTETLVVGGASVVTEVESVVNERHVTAEAQNGNHYRTSYAQLHLGDGVSFSFGLQSGDGGLVMENNSEVVGDVYANGTVVGKGTNASNGNTVRGHIVSATTTGLVQGVVATGSIWAHTIKDATAQQHAYYQALTGSVAVGPGGASCSGANTYCHPGSPDEDTIEFPIPQSLIDKWKNEAAAGGVIASTDPRCPSGTMTISASTTTTPLKIECNVVLEGNSTVLSITAPLWITGTLEIKTGADIAIESSHADESIAVVADDTITLNNSGDFLGAPGNSFLILIGTLGNPSTDVAIEANQGTGGEAVLYAPDGRIRMSNSVNVKELTAHTVHLRNNTIVRYESGLMSLTVPDPDGGYSLDLWNEIE